MDKSLLIVTEAFELGGVETYIRSEVEGLVRRGWKVHLVCGRRFSDEMLPEGLASVTSDLALGPEAGINDFLGAVDQIVAIARRENVSVIDAHPFTSLIPALASASILRVPCVATLHGPGSVAGSYGPAYDFMLASLVLPAASRVLAVSGEVATLAAPYVEPERLMIQYNPIDVPPAVLGVERTDRWLIVSRLDAAKIDGVVAFIRSAAAIGLPGVDVCGDGPFRARLEDSLQDLLASGWLRMLGSHPNAAGLMSGYQGVAGMGRVALEGLAAGLPVVLVGYDGIKGLLEQGLYEQAVQRNLSGRGLANIGSEELADQLRLRTKQSTAAITAYALAERNAGRIWQEFERELQRMKPVRSVVLNVYLQQLRAMHPTSTASAYWSREVMAAMERVVASPLAVNTPLLQAFSVYSQAFTRSIVEQQGSATRDSMAQQPAPVVEIIADTTFAASVQETLVKLERQIESFAQDTSLSSQSMLSTVELEMQRTLDVLRPDVEGLTDQLQEIAGSIASDQRHEASRLRDALHTQSTRLVAGIGERLSAEVEMLRRFHLQASDHARSELGGEFERLREVARIESENHIELVKREMSAFRDVIRQQTIASAGEFRRDTRLAFNEAIRGFEIKMERAIEGMELTLRKDLADVAGGLDVHAEMNRDIIELNERIGKLEQELVEVYGSSSWVLTRPLRVFKRLLLQPRATWRLMGKAIAGAPEVGEGGDRQPRTSKLRHAWNFIRRSIRTGRIDPADKARLLGMIRSNYTNAVAGLGIEVQRPELAAATAQLEDVFVWSVIDWHFRMQRPQHLAAAMAAKGHRVFYISNNFVDSTTPGFSVEALDQDGRLFQVNLNVAGAPQIYFDVASADQVAAIQASLAKLLKWTTTSASISLVQHPFWLEPAQSLPNMRLVYDCMDHHGGFEDNAASVLAGERSLVEGADLLIVTSQWLQDEMEGKSQSIAMIRNATEYEHFCDRPEDVFIDESGRRVIGYYGAIAEWFDVELVRQVALDHPQALVLLVGRDTAGAADRLAGVANVRFTGEVPYKDLPYWLHGFDVCLLPFRVIPLTLATNPVKVYEYLSAGKPTVSVDLPELSQFEGLVRLATEPAAFSREVSAALQADANTVAHMEARKAFARRQTWAHRAADLDKALAAISEPKVSVIVLCYNNLEFTQACLHSIDLYSDYPNLEIIAVDNASSDGTPEYLLEWQSGADNRVFIRNDSNLGFSAGNNVGLRAATGEYLVVLNNDTYVTPGWVRGMVRHLRRNPKAGLIGPVTNNIGNEARIEIHYATMGEMIERAGDYTRRHPGVSFGMTTAAFFCVMMTRHAYETVGPMDEDFGVGFFEDDDYCRRLSLNGFEVRCADDVFVHHHLSASFNKLKADTKQVLFEKNKAIYEKKWGPWVPHVYRDRASH